MFKNLLIALALVVAVLALLLGVAADFNLSHASYKVKAIAGILQQPVDAEEIALLEQQRAELKRQQTLQRQFEEILKGGMQDEATLTQLQNFSDQHPDFLPPYSILAARYAADGQLSLARQTLIKGLQANPQSKLLHDNLLKVQGTLAANAYKAAVNEEAEMVTSLELPTNLLATP